MIFLCKAHPLKTDTLSDLAGSLRNTLAENLAPARFTHVMGVEGLAVSLALDWGVDPEKVMLAALLHDFAKGQPRQALEEQLRKATDYAPTQEDWQHPELWHGLVAAKVARDQFGIQDEDIRQAVAYHTTGIPDLNPVGLVLFVADTLEPARRFPLVEQHRRDILSQGMIPAARKTARLKLELVQHHNKQVHGNTRLMLQWLESLHQDS